MVDLPYLDACGITYATPSMPQQVDCPTGVAVAPKFGLGRTWPGLVEKC